MNSATITMHTKEQLKKISEAYFQALRDKNFSAIPFSDDIAFRAPLAPGGAHHPIKGKKNVFEQWWKPLEPALDGVTINIIDHYYNESLTGTITKSRYYNSSFGCYTARSRSVHHK